MWTCIPCSAACLLQAYALSAPGETNSHTNTFQILLCTQRGRGGVRDSYIIIQQRLLRQGCGQWNASRQAGGGRVGTTCKVSVNNAARVKLWPRVDAYTQVVKQRLNVRQKRCQNVCNFFISFFISVFKLLSAFRMYYHLKCCKNQSIRYFNPHICMFFIVILCQWRSEIYMATFPLDRKPPTPTNMWLLHSVGKVTTGIHSWDEWLCSSSVSSQHWWEYDTWVVVIIFASLPVQHNDALPQISSVSIQAACKHCSEYISTQFERD